jgi:hypothetical protein
MGTKKENSQKHIDKLTEMLHKLGWSQRTFSDNYFANTYDLEDTCTPEEYDTFFGKLKKHLQRPTTPAATIQGYIEYLEKTDEFRKVGGIRTQLVSDDILSSEILEELKDISKCVTDIVRKNKTEGI